MENASWQGTSLFGSYKKKHPEEGGQVLLLRGHKRSGPSGHPPGPLGVCNPNEKQKPPPLVMTVPLFLCVSATDKRHFFLQKNVARFLLVDVQLAAVHTSQFKHSGSSYDVT